MENGALTHGFKDYELEYKDEHFLVTSIINVYIEDHGIGPYDYGGAKGYDSHIGIGEVNVLGWSVKKCDEATGEYNKCYFPELNDGMQSQFIEDVYDIISDINISEEYV